MSGKIKSSAKYKILYRDRAGNENETAAVSKSEALTLYHIYEQECPFVMMVNARTGESYF